MKITLFVVLLFNGTCLTLGSKTSESQSGSSLHFCFFFSPLPHLMDHDINCQTNLKPPESRGLKRAAQVKFVMPSPPHFTIAKQRGKQNKTKENLLFSLLLSRLIDDVATSHARHLNQLDLGRRAKEMRLRKMRFKRKQEKQRPAPRKKKRGNTRHLNGQMDLSRNLETIQSAERILKKRAGSR